ncbi:hypothetical protein ALC57_09758 [Trachymyrmex cornetzi]|uniref:Uncharacterized protein n=1 Tax=Trachymyrmex cornetzi TaxID=471704 RepID=A0A195DYF8_9HYME|nr:hypothetical protein ALC57_09758 [Trachymyrmex cornetzi]
MATLDPPGCRVERCAAGCGPPGDDFAIPLRLTVLAVVLALSDYQAGPSSFHSSATAATAVVAAAAATAAARSSAASFQEINVCIKELASSPDDIKMPPANTARQIAIRFLARSIRLTCGGLNRQRVHGSVHASGRDDVVNGFQEWSLIPVSYDRRGHAGMPASLAVRCSA